MFSIDSHRSAEEFHLLSTVWFVLQEHKDFRSESLKDRSTERLWVTLFGFDSVDIHWDRMHYGLMDVPGYFKPDSPSRLGAIYAGYISETTRFFPGPILARRLSRVAISCLQYLFRGRANAQDHFLPWAVKSKQSPWFWRQRIRVTSTRRPTYSCPQSLRRSRQILYSERIQSEKFYQFQRTFYIWTLKLLYHTLRKAGKCDELTRALSKAFIPLSASFLFPRQIKQVRKAVNAYLEKVNWRACSHLKIDRLMYHYRVIYQFRLESSSAETFGRRQVGGLRLIR